MNAKLLGLSLVLLSLAGTPASALVEVATLGNKHLADVQMELRNLLGNTNIDLQGFIVSRMNCVPCFPVRGLVCALK